MIEVAYRASIRRDLFLDGSCASFESSKITSIPPDIRRVDLTPQAPYFLQEWNTEKYSPSRKKKGENIRFG